MKKITDVKRWQNAQTVGKLMSSSGSDRNTLWDEIDDIFLLRTAAENDAEKAVEVISPVGRNAAIGVERMLTSGEPVVSIAQDEAAKLDEAAANKLETALMDMWRASSQVTGIDVVRDAVKAATLYGETHIAVMLTSDLLEAMKGLTPAAIRRAEAVQDQTPALFRVMRARNGYSIFDALGMTHYYREDETTVAEVINLYGQAKIALESQSLDAQVTLFEYWDLSDHFVWVTGMNDPLVAEEHELPFIPVAVGIADGSNLFDPEERSQPFLYTYDKAGLFGLQNTMLSSLMQAVQDFGTGPSFIWQSNDPQKTLEVDYSGRVRYIKVQSGDQIQPANNRIVDGEFFQAFNITRELDQQSTIFGQALGQPMSGNASFSMVAMLSQSGRNPLAGINEAVNRAMTDASRIALELLAMKKIKHPLYEGVTLPDRVRKLSVRLELALPQDAAKNAQLAMMASGGDDPLISKEYALEKFLQVNDPSQMRRDILKEKTFMALAMAKMQQYVQQASMPPAPPMPTGAPGQMPPGQVPPEMAAQMQPPPGQAGPLGPQQGVEMTEPLPPGMNQGGLM